MWARTDTGGRVWLHPNAFDPAHAAVYEIAVRQGGRQARGFLRRGQKSAVEVTLSSAPLPARAQLDLVFLIDATGSMADEIGKLKASLADIAPVLQATPDELLQHLQQKGYKAGATSDTVAAIAAASQANANEVLYAMLPARRAGKPASR